VLHRRRHQVGDGDRRHLQGLPLALEAGQFQQLLGHLGQGVHLGFHALEEVPCGGRIADGAVAQRLDEGLQGGDRRAQFVGGVGDKVAPQPHDAAQVAEILQDDHAADAGGVGHRRGDDVQVQPAAEEFDGGGLLALRLAAQGPEVGDLVMADDLHEGAPDGVRRADAEQAGGRRIDQPHFAGGRGDDDAIGHVRQDGGEVRLLGLVGGDALLQLLRHGVEGAAQLADLVVGEGRGAGAEVALAHARRRLGELAHRPRDALGQPDHHQHGAEGRQQGGDEHRAGEAGGLAVDDVQRQRHPHHAAGVVPQGERHRSVEQAVAERAALADGVALAVPERVAHLRPAQVIVHGGGVGLRIAEHEPAGGDDGHPRSQLLPPGGRQGLGVAREGAAVRIAAQFAGQKASVGQEMPLQDGEPLLAHGGHQVGGEPAQRREHQEGDGQGNAPAKALHGCSSCGGSFRR